MLKIPGKLVLDKQTLNKPLMSSMAFQVSCSTTSTESVVAIQTIGKRKNYCGVSTIAANIRAEFAEING